MIVEQYTHNNLIYSFEFDADRLQCVTVAVSSPDVDAETNGHSQHDSIDYTYLQKMTILGRDASSRRQRIVVPAAIVKKFVVERLREDLSDMVDELPSDALWSRFGSMMRVAHDSRVTDATVQR